MKLTAETDFVAKTDDFQSLARDIAMQIAAVNPLHTLNREEVPAEVIEHEKQVLLEQAKAEAEEDVKKQAVNQNLKLFWKNGEWPY